MNILFCLIVFLFIFPVYGDIERRAAIDIGSGGTKVAIADVDVDHQQIVQVIYETSFPVPYQAALDKSSNATIDEETKALGIQTFQKIKQLTDEHQVVKIAAIATSAFRKATNGQEFAQEVEALTQIPIRIIPQKEEGEIAFFSAVATGAFRPEEIIVWDIGTGSLQMTTQDENRDLSVYMGEQMGAVSFKAYIMDELQDKDLQDALSPNPMSDDDFYFAGCYARSFARRAHLLLKSKINAQAPVVGIGRLFNNSLRPIAAEEGVITRSGLRHYILKALNKNDAELRNPFAHVDVSNCILALSIMKALHIHEIHPVDTTTTKGMLIYPAYWQ